MRWLGGYPLPAYPKTGVARSSRFGHARRFTRDGRRPVGVPGSICAAAFPTVFAAVIPRSAENSMALPCRKV